MDPHNPDEILDAVASYYGIAVEEIRSGRRTRHRTQIRRVAALLLKETGIYSHSDVARILDYGDHSAAYSAVRWARNHLRDDPRMRAGVEVLRRRIGISTRKGGA